MNEFDHRIFLSLLKQQRKSRGITNLVLRVFHLPTPKAAGVGWGDERPWERGCDRISANRKSSHAARTLEADATIKISKMATSETAVVLQSLIDTLELCAGKIKG